MVETRTVDKIVGIVHRRACQGVPKAHWGC